MILKPTYTALTSLLTQLKRHHYCSRMSTNVEMNQMSLRNPNSKNSLREVIQTRMKVMQALHRLRKIKTSLTTTTMRMRLARTWVTRLITMTISLKFQLRQIRMRECSRLLGWFKPTSTDKKARRSHPRKEASRRETCSVNQKPRRSKTKLKKLRRKRTTKSNSKSQPSNNSLRPNSKG